LISTIAAMYAHALQPGLRLRLPTAAAIETIAAAVAFATPTLASVVCNAVAPVATTAAVIFAAALLQFADPAANLANAFFGMKNFP
jgi:hypothetical protein